MLTRRDLQLINTCDRYGVITTNQIKAKLFCETNKRTMLRRLRKLEKLKIIQRFEGLPRGKLVWTLGAKGLAFADGGLPISLSRGSLEHDCMVTAVRLALDKISFGHNFQSHFDLRASPGSDGFDQIPDASFLLSQPSRAKVALEVELSIKSKARYRKIATTYSSKNDISYVWYVLRNQKQMSALKKIISKVGDPLGHPFYVFSHMDELLTNPGQAKVYFGDKVASIWEVWEK